MAAGDDFAKVADLDVRIDLGRRKPSMTEQFLYLPDVGFAFQQVCRAGVTKRVRRDVLFDLRSASCLLDDANYVGVVERTPRSARYEQTGLRGLTREGAARFLEIELQC
jgi:hypothetical protein